SHRGERIGVADQAREFCERIAFRFGRIRLPVTIVVVPGRIGPVLISISHRDDASPSGKPPTRFSKEPAPAGCHAKPPRRGTSIAQSAHLGWCTDAENP